VKGPNHRFLISLMAVSFLFLVVISTPSSALEDYMTVDDVTMSLRRGDALMEMNYTLNSFAYLYVLALGCNYIEPELASIFKSFGDAKITRADPYSAAFVIKDAGRNTHGYYLFDSKPLGSRISRLKVVYPGGISKTFFNVTSTPNVFCEA